ncbi:NUDIX domain-containing protein [Vitreoscilla massiliensis]|uniref:NUDIX domain-containing protein n=1 Tax=Vitreoscilla massiliensis TaxID=1689272 RepID=A0ABY4E5L7_9NEIS|nr:NUDIX domain-containing protein [Vitreoscilla massiliensis]UOO90650.1 NUDIX domain-containing protein [Vitreoscilla massiliensis]
MTQAHTLATAGLIIVQHKALLLAYSKHKQAWYLPGGKIDAGETAEQALLREINEELSLNLDTTRLRHYTHISAPAYGEYPAITMEQDCFVYDLGCDTFQAQAEIGAARYFTWDEFQQLDTQVAGVIQVYAHLRADGWV